MEKLHDTATECHSPYGITQCYLLSYTSEHTPPSPQRVPARRAGTRLTDHLRMEGWISPGPGCKEQLAHGCYATSVTNVTSRQQLYVTDHVTTGTTSGIRASTEFYTRLGQPIKHARLKFISSTFRELKQFHFLSTLISNNETSCIGSLRICQPMPLTVWTKQQEFSSATQIK